MALLTLLAVFAATLALVPGADAYNGGPALLVTDLASSCAGCHASVQREQLRNLPEALQDAQWVENKHYKQIEAGEGPYKDMTPTDRARLLADVKAIDAVVSAVLTGPTTARPGQEITVTATVKGGAGPAIGVFLVDTDVRFQTRPVTADGWVIAGPPGSPARTVRRRRAGRAGGPRGSART